MLLETPFIKAYCTFVAAVLGACMGSFLNCCAWRILHHESVMKGRSHCDVCGHVLNLRDLVPVFSYLFSRGRCRYCGAKLSLRHVVAEVISAAVFVSVFLKFGLTLELIEALILASLLLVISFADLEGYIIPDRFILAAIVVRCAFMLIQYPLAECGLNILGAAAVPAVLLLLVLVAEKILKRDAMGGGDIKLLFVTGLILGWQKNILCLLLACILGILFGIIGKLFESKKPSHANLKTVSKDSAENAEEEDPTHIPWGPGIAAAAWLCVFIGDTILSAYMSLF